MSEQTIPQMRDQIDSLEKQLGEAKRDLGTTQAENRTLQARDQFREAGYDPAHGELFAKTNPEGDITSDVISNFVKEFKLQPAGTSEATEGTQEGEAEGTEKGGESKETGAEGLGLMGRSGSGAGDGGQQSSGDNMLTVSEYAELAAKDSVAAQQAVQQNRIRFSDDNPWVKR